MNLSIILNWFNEFALSERNAMIEAVSNYNSPFWFYMYLYVGFTFWRYTLND